MFKNNGKKSHFPQLLHKIVSKFRKNFRSRSNIIGSSISLPFVTLYHKKVSISSNIHNNWREQAPALQTSLRRYRRVGVYSRREFVLWMKRNQYAFFTAPYTLVE